MNVKPGERARSLAASVGRTLTCGETFGVICLIFCAVMADRVISDTFWVVAAIYIVPPQV